jgi:3-oxoacyl-[acyl-carrier protein] reductase
VPDVAAFETASLFDLSGRRAVVTGAAHGIGFGIATALVGAGARVAMIDIEAEQLIRAATQAAAYGETHALAADVRSDMQVTEVVANAAQKLGGIDIVVNAAAVYPVKRFVDSSAHDLLDVLDVNVAGYARLIRAAKPCLDSSDHPRVINISSITFMLGIWDGMSSYVASKGAVIGLTRALAREFGPTGVTVNAICPGAIPTRTEEGLDGDARLAVDAQLVEKQSIKRRGSARDIAAATLFLASEAASFITGQMLVVDGGWVFD